MRSSTFSVNVLFASMDTTICCADSSERHNIDLRIFSSDNRQESTNSSLFSKQWSIAFAGSSAITILNKKAETGRLEMAMANCEMNLGAW